MTTTIDYDTAKALLQRAVEEKGSDYVYEKSRTALGGSKCTYAWNGEPSCIVGRVFSYAGVPVETLEKLDNAQVEFNSDGTSVSSLESSGILSKVGIEVHDARVVSLLSYAQASQDMGFAWGSSVERAVRKVEGDF